MPKRVIRRNFKKHQEPPNRARTRAHQCQMPQYNTKTFIKYKRLVKETLYNSLAQAIIKIVETPYLTIKACLFTFIIISSGLCSFLIIELVMSYLSFGVTTASRTLYETPALFPKVTICNVNPLTTEYAVEFLRTINQEYDQSVDIFDENQTNQLNVSFKSELIINVYYRAIFKMNSLNETEKRKFSRPLEDLIQNCYFNAQPCSASDFAWYFDPFYGNCWMFNSGRNKSGHEVNLGYNNFPGEFYGFSVIFYVNFHKNLATLNSYNGGGLGALIRIDNSSYLTSYIGSDGIKIEPGHKTSVSVSRSFKSSLPKPYSNCLIDNQTNARFHSELFDIISNSAYRYTQPTCFLQCLQRAILYECKCTDPSILSLFSNGSQCLTSEQTQCMIHLYDEKLYKNDFVHGNCLDECPLECYLVKFDTSLSSIEFLSNYYLDYLNSHTEFLNDFVQSNLDDLEMVRKSFVSLNIFYSALSYELSTESPQTDFIWLFASIGGYLGLFLGVSVFSLFEPFIVLIDIAFRKFTKSSYRVGNPYSFGQDVKINLSYNKQQSVADVFFYDRVSVI
jgi:hypothetical protein